MEEIIWILCIKGELDLEDQQLKLTAISIVTLKNVTNHMGILSFFQITIFRSEGSLN